MGKYEWVEGMGEISGFGTMGEGGQRYEEACSKMLLAGLLWLDELWFLSGKTDIEILRRHGCKFWDAWAARRELRGLRVPRSRARTGTSGVTSRCPPWARTTRSAGPSKSSSGTP